MLPCRKLYKIEWIYNLEDLYGSVLTQSSISPILELIPMCGALFNWVDNLDEAETATLDELLGMISSRNPDVWRGKTAVPSQDDVNEFTRRLMSWIREGFGERSMQLELLDKSSNQLLADVETVTVNERLEDDDSGRDTNAESDMPITSTFANSLASPDTLQDKLSRLAIAQREYAHLWKDQMTLNDPRGTLPQRIQEALDAYRSIMREWTEEFMDRFAIIGEDQDEIDE